MVGRRKFDEGDDAISRLFGGSELPTTKGHALQDQEE
jgi:hypothetical protein